MVQIVSRSPSHMSGIMKSSLLEKYLFHMSSSATSDTVWTKHNKISKIKFTWNPFHKGYLPGTAISRPQFILEEMDSFIFYYQSDMIHYFTKHLFSMIWSCT